MEAPISASLGAIGSLIRKLDLLLDSSEEVNGCRPRSHKGAKYGMHLLRDDLEEISSYLQDLSELEDPPMIAKCWMKEARELSYDIEDYIDRFVFSGHVANIKTRCRRISHIKIARLVETNKKLIRRKRVAAMISDFRVYTQEAIERHKRYELDCSNLRRRFQPEGRLLTTYEEETDIIIHGGMTKFMDSLDNDWDEQLKVVSVVGSGGIGKTTFVTVLYQKLKGHFDCGAFVRLTRKPDIKTVLRDILTQVQRQQPHHDHGEDPDLIGKIREHLQHKRYLIIIDDLWSASIWDVINHAFPGGGMCSRIIATTQIEDVALACCCYHSDYVFEMRPLEDDLSRKLFFNSLFCSESDFPHAMKEVSNKIIRICGGSPLAITIIARLLASHPVMLMEQWTCIYDSLNFNLRTCSTSEGLLKLIVNFSYNNLTHQLKTCLLYLSMYPEGCTVCKDDLVKQWVAEGFIDATGGREVEIAESYFHELIARRFLQPADIRYNSEVVSCSVHEVVRDLVVQKSLEENFVMVLDCYRRNVSLSEKVHRLSLHFPQAKYARTNIRSSQVRSLAYFGLSNCMPSIREFKIIRVLNLGLSGHEDGDDTIDLTVISELLQLKYLKVASDVCIELPKHMRRLHYLETLDIGTKITHVPWDIIHLPCLLHLHLPFETNLMDWICAIPASVSSLGKLTNLQYLHLTCSIPVPADHLRRNIKALSSLLGGHGNLKTLALILGSAHKNVVHSPSEVTSWDEFTPPLLERFEWLPHIFTFSRVPKWMGKLGNLRILKISVRQLLSGGVNILGKLSALTALSLYLQMAPVKRIVFHKAGFSALKYFELICSTVPCLKFEMDTMPNLKRLKLGFSAHRVDQHGTTPISIEHLPSLEEISAKVGNTTSSDAETALTAAVTNHPRNPRIRVHLVDWNFCSAGVSYMISKQKEPQTLEENEILEEGLDKILDHIQSKKRKFLDRKKQKDYVSRHGGVKRHRKENCAENVKSRDVLTSPYILGEQSITIEGKASASSSGISSRSTMFSYISEVPSPQQRNSKIEKCQFEGCKRKARGSSRRCVDHGGVRRCEKLGCTKSAERRTDFCIAHGGGLCCRHEGCSRAVHGKSSLCIKHGGGKRCQKVNCTKSAEGHSGLCIAHGGVPRCQFPDCTKGAQGSTKFCKAHGEGKRCTFLGCTSGAEGSTAFCKGHGGGKRCAFEGGGVCTKSVHRGTQYCVAHGGGKRCASSGCTKSARGGTEYCARHGGGKRCKSGGCTKSAQGSTDFCKAHGGGMVAEKDVGRRIAPKADEVHDGGKTRQDEDYIVHGGAQEWAKSENSMPDGPLISQTLQQPGMPGRSRRHPDLTLQLPHRGLTSLAVPLPLPPSSGSLPGPASLGTPTSAGSMPPNPPPPLCELERVRSIGSGAGGTVWMVRHRPTGRAYALKVLYGKHDDAVRRQIAREVAVLRTAEHPALVRCHGMYERDGELQILLEYMDGGSLAGHHIADERFLAHLARQVLSGIAYLHGRHIVHRDIKPSKLLVDSGRRVKIADFGVGCILNQDPCNSSVGSIAYMSPERINTDLNDGAYDGYAGDIWSFGLTILEVYLGWFPLGENLTKQGDWAALMCAICYSDSPQAPRDASPEFKNFISLCLQKNPANRPTALRLLQHPFVALPQPQAEHESE